MVFRYNHSYYPAAPFVDVSFITAAESLRVGPLPAFVDSGADGTIVPISYLYQIRAPSTDDVSIRGQWGDSRLVLLYLVDVQIGDLLLPGIEVVGDEISNEIVIGRDILNKVQVWLNGPKEEVTLSE